MDLGLPTQPGKNRKATEFEDVVSLFGFKVETAIKRIRNKKMRS
jgi:hypothetical protein